MSASGVAHDLGLTELERALSKLSLPQKNATDAEGWTFKERLRALTIHYRDIGHDWSLSISGEQRRFGNYINATSLLQDCLELAFMPPDQKKAMLNSLYLPPAQADEGQNV